MEMPIQVVVAFTVALAVGLGILAFSTDMFNWSSQKVNEFGNDVPSPSDTVLELGQISDVTLQELASQCIKEKRSSGIKDICYAVRYTSAFPSTIDGKPVGSTNFKFRVIKDMTGATSLFMYLNPISGTIDIER
jgi:hypothetical protein